MAYSQQTTHYGLPLPTSGDKSTFLDTNDAFSRIDSDIYEAKTNATAAVQDIGQIQLDVSQLKASTLEIQTDISQLTSRQTISETNITALQSAMTTAQTDVAKLQNDYGTTDISDIGDGTVTGAIASLASDNESVSVTADGVKTISQLFDELYALIDRSKLTTNSKLKMSINGIDYISDIEQIQATIIVFTNAVTTISNSIAITTAALQATGSHYNQASLTGTPAISFQDLSSTTSINGSTYSIYY